MSKSKNILFQMTGSIACFKACEVLSALAKEGHNLQVVASQSTFEFIGRSTLEGLTGHPVASDLFKPGQAMDHIHLARWADIYVLCPATAHTINKLAAGMADDLIGTLFLAADRHKPYLIVPAMNATMLAHPSVSDSVLKLKSWGIDITETEQGILACGEVGYGRLPQTETILSKIKSYFQTPSSPQDPHHTKKILITSGGTREPIDQVRSIANISTGRTGSELADYFDSLGCDVTLLRAHASQKPKSAGVHLREFYTTADLSEHLKNLLVENSFDLVIHAAAVSDYTVDAVFIDDQCVLPSEIKKLSSNQSVSIKLKRQEKIIDQLRVWSKNKNIKICGFKLTSSATTDEIQKSVSDLFSHASLDFVAQNDTDKLSPSRSEHEFNVFDPELNQITRAMGPCELGKFLQTQLHGEKYDSVP